MRSLLLLPILALAALSSALGIGDKAPPMQVEAVVKGEKVDLSKGVHVVEFWATWCGPCKVSIPHLTELAKKYKGKVDFTGVSVAEQGDDQLGQVKKFVAAMGPKMDYNVAFDGADAAMDKSYMDAANQNGIPAAFLVKDGTILWIGHPMGGLKDAIDQTLSGKYDIEKAKTEFAKQEEAQKKQADEMAAKQAEAQKKQAEIQALMAPVVSAMQEGDFDAALVEIDKIEAKRPDLKVPMAQTRFAVLIDSGSPKLVALSKRFATTDFKNDAEALNEMAWAIVDPESKLQKPNYEAALILAKQAAEASKMKNGNILDTYALALFKNGDKKNAYAVQKKAVELVKKDKEAEPATVKELEGRLEEYRKANA